MNQLIKSGIIAGILTAAVSAQAATYCIGNTECFAKATSKVKQAAQHGCTKEAEALAALALDVQSHDAMRAEVTAIEECVERAKYNARIAKKSDKRLERLQKALNTPIKAKK